MKKLKLIISVIVAIFLATNIFAQSDLFLVNTASKAKKWEYVKAEFDKYEFGKLALKKVEKKFGVATSIVIDSTGNFMWTITNATGSKTSVGMISESGNDSFFEFEDGNKLKVQASFKNYDTEMCLTIYGMETDEYVNLIYKKQ
jgi:hypothetical protein